MPTRSGAPGPSAASWRRCGTSSRATTRRQYGLEDSPIHDALALAYVLRPDLLETVERNVEIDCASELCRGRTVVDLWRRTDRAAERARGGGRRRRRLPRPARRADRSSRHVTEDGLRRDLGRLVRELLNERVSTGTPVADVLRGHLGDDARALPVLGEELDTWELPNLQLALDALLARPGYEADVVGLVGHGKRYAAFSLSDLLGEGEWVPAVGPPEYVNVPVGPDRDARLPGLRARAPAHAARPRGPLRPPRDGGRAGAQALRPGCCVRPGGCARPSRRAAAAHGSPRRLPRAGADRQGRPSRRPRPGLPPPAVARGLRDRHAGGAAGADRAPRHRPEQASGGTRRRRPPPLARAAPLGAARHRQVPHRPLPRVRR